MSWVEQNSFKYKSLEDLKTKYIKAIAACEERTKSLIEEIAEHKKKYGPKKDSFIEAREHSLVLIKEAIKDLEFPLNELSIYMLDNTYEVKNCFLIEELKYIKCLKT